MKSAIGQWLAARTRVFVSPGVARVRYCLPHLDQQYRENYFSPRAVSILRRGIAASLQIPVPNSSA